MADLPILFSGSMVRALLADRKTQTRRVLFPQPQEDIGLWMAEHKPRYAVGDRLYVREEIQSWHSDGNKYVRFAADQKATFHIWPEHWVRDVARPMHMPKKMSRLTLTVTDVRVQRLREISEADAIAEGIHVQRLAEWAAKGEYVGEGNRPILMDADDPSAVYMTAADADSGWETAREAYVELWDDLNEFRGFGWGTNPFVVAYTFTKQNCNIERSES